MVAINKYSNVPLYCQLKNLIIQKIESGEFEADQKIPSEQVFYHHISRPTVRQAINELTAAGQLYKLKGKGTLYLHKNKYINEIVSFTDSILDTKDPSKRYIIH